MNWSPNLAPTPMQCVQPRNIFTYWWRILLSQATSWNLQCGGRMGNLHKVELQLQFWNLLVQWCNRHTQLAHEILRFADRIRIDIQLHLHVLTWLFTSKMYWKAARKTRQVVSAKSEVKLLILITTTSLWVSHKPHYAMNLPLRVALIEQ